MKKWYAFTAIFLCSYTTFLVATMPLALLINNLQLPKNVSVGHVSGSIWDGQIKQIVVSNNKIENIETNVSFWSLLLFSLKIDATFGGTMLEGPEGNFTLTASSGKLLLNDVELFLSASDISSQLKFPIPVNAQGSVELTLSELALNTSDSLVCEQAKGQVTWLRSGVVALDQNIKIGTLKADVGCDKGDLTAKISPKNNLGLSLTARLALPSKKPSGQGYLKPGAKFPTGLTNALSFLGKPDGQGRYRLKF